MIVWCRDKTLAILDKTHIRFLPGNWYPTTLGNCPIITILGRVFSRKQKKLDGITRWKIRNRENWKIFTGFRDMTDFVTGNRNQTPPLLAPYRRHSYKKHEAVNLIRNNIRALDYIWEINKHRSRAILAILITLRPHASFEVNPSFDKVFVWPDFFISLLF